MSAERRAYLIAQEDAGTRLDVYLSRQLSITRAQAAQWIAKGRVQLEGRQPGKAGISLRAGQRLAVDIPAPAPMAAQAEALPLDILYQDAALAVVIKPCGMVVHPAAGHASGTLVNALLHHLEGLSGIGGVMRPGIVHRLDKDTSGLMLVAKTDAAHVSLSRQLAAHQMEKVYAALALGRFSGETGEIDAPIARNPKDRKRMAVVSGGREALTRYRVAEPFAGCALLRVRILTGRTHQIRVHLRHIGHPVVGDPLYAPAKAQVTAPRLMLHAASLGFVHPLTGAWMRFDAPFPADFLEPLAKQRAALGPGYAPPDFFALEDE